MKGNTMSKTALCIVMLFASCGVAGAQQYRVIWNFAGSVSGDGSAPQGGLALDSAGNLYGTTQYGGAFCPLALGCGTVFRLSPNSDGTWTETILYSFCANSIGIQCLDGKYPEAGLTFDSAGNIYGTTTNGGDQTCALNLDGCGTVFELSPPSQPNGSWTENVLYSFCSLPGNNACTDGNYPHGPVAFDALGNLYGTTLSGGTGHVFESGTVFELSPGANGWTETVLYNFCSLGQGRVCPDGAEPAAGVTFDKSGNLYGTTQLGGAMKDSGIGTVYKLSPWVNGWIESILYQFRYPNGGAPLARVTLDSAGSLYTTFSLFGKNGGGGVLRLSSSHGGTSGTVSFNGNNGLLPEAGVTLDSQYRVLYGTTLAGGENLGGGSGGTIFEVVPPAQIIVLYSFCSQTNCTDGQRPQAGLTSDHAGHLYGTTNAGGLSNNGVVFEIQ
jgi:uncharacterized repeat protein (TIGR03803 family)